ncbi:DUF1127 domain-containing protein [Shimia marina]|uniref:YjiS-like domain-containing protein n=1 Tax=Shimia marina TaxID=321267 RepID=A0A0P1F9L5_9RHOB|nr:DUF1127 domain-containing protein [Shimia marina]CUH52245.1 hypothetical protein SHM7688_01691 [Shimia marina]SFE06668.1 Uncharacterized conserved protein YjiS, DUF1127 family [Shimia marina]
MAFISIPSAAPAAGKSILSRLKQAAAVRRQRRQLAQLDSFALDDLGLTNADVQEELKRTAWDVPAHWKG